MYNYYGDNMKKKLIFLSALILLFTGCGSENSKELTKTNLIVPTMQDAISEDGLWVGTFQLVWNDLKNELVKQDIEIDSEIVANLNKETYTENDISSEYYYKKYGVGSPELKAEIERGIKEKFDQSSDILDDLDWTSDFIFYTMLYREFEFENKFDILSNNDFNIYKDVKYFGIGPNSNNKLGKQIRILFYENDQNFAISIKTKNGDEVIMYKNPEGSTFEEMYENMNSKSNEYNGSTTFGEDDEFKAPLISVNYLRVYEEVINKPFYTADGRELIIGDALQTIRFDLDEKGGKVKSEAAIAGKYAAIPIDEKPKKLYVNDTFTLFLKEENKEKPYLAAKITDITKFQ